MKMSVLAALVLLALIANPIHAGWFGPGNYDECVLENMKGVQSERAAREISFACRRQFPAKPKDEKYVGDCRDVRSELIQARAALEEYFVYHNFSYPAYLHQVNYHQKDGIISTYDGRRDWYHIEIRGKGCRELFWTDSETPQIEESIAAE